jgi:hypothetical protein
MNITDVDISDFEYVSTHADPDRTYFGSAACRFIASDVIHQILHNRDSVIGYETRYFSHVVGIYTHDSCWTFSIDMDLLDFDNFEIVAVSNRNDSRIHVKNGNWFNNIDDLRGIGAITETAAIFKAVWYIIQELRYLYSSRSKKYCKILAEQYASDFEEK